LNTLSDLTYEGRTMKYVADLEQKIKDLTTDDVAKAVRKNLHPKDLVIVRAGEFEKKDSAGDHK
jgi:predicted Zn-dependent peptidase